MNNLNNLTKEELQELEDEEVEFDLVHYVLDSLKKHSVDYCFTKKDFDKILQIAKKEDINLVYKIFKDNNNSLEYVRFTPVYFFKKVNGKKIYLNTVNQFEENNIPNGISYCLRKRKSSKYKKDDKIPENAQTKKRPTVDFLAKAQGKDYLFFQKTWQTSIFMVYWVKSNKSDTKEKIL